MIVTVIVTVTVMLKAIVATMVMATMGRSVTVMVGDGG